MASIAATLRTKKASVCDLSVTDKDFQIHDETWYITERVNTYLIDCLETYEDVQYTDERLFELFQEDFNGWTTDLFALADKTIRTPFKAYLMNQGILISGTGVISQQLVTCL